MKTPGSVLRYLERGLQPDSFSAVPVRMPGTFSSDEKRARHRRPARKTVPSVV